MNKVIFNNGIRLVYKHISSNLTSFSIAFEAGANVEQGEKIGIAHAVEHMVFKGSKNRNEEEINELCDKYFGFNNATTNYPYVSYYGTTLSQDFEKAFELYSDIILNPTFPTKGFKEEIDIICEELKEWNEDVYQNCEDELFKNAFAKRRIKDLIIGSEESVRTITISDIKDFYHKYYTADNCVISVVSSLEFEFVLSIVKKYFADWEHSLDVKNTYLSNNYNNIYEENKEGIFTTYNEQVQGAKVQFCYTLHKLNEEEMKALRIFNEAFGEGTSSILYDQIRTKHGLAYEIGSSIKNEKGIKVFKISLGTSKDKVQEAIHILNHSIDYMKEHTMEYFTEERIEDLIKRIQLKRNLLLERSIQESVSLAVYEIMYEPFKRKEASLCTVFDNNYISPLFREINNLNKITNYDILSVINKTLIKPTIQILSKHIDINI